MQIKIVFFEVQTEVRILTRDLLIFKYIQILVELNSFMTVHFFTEKYVRFAVAAAKPFSFERHPKTASDSKVKLLLGSI